MVRQRRTQNSQINHFTIRWDLEAEVSLLEVGIPESEQDVPLEHPAKGKHVLPIMREQKTGVITNISSVAATCATGIVAYKTSKAGVNAFTHALATGNAKYGIRANAILPGLMNTPMAIEGISRARGIPQEQLIAARSYEGPEGLKAVLKNKDKIEE